MSLSSGLALRRCSVGIGCVGHVVLVLSFVEIFDEQFDGGGFVLRQIDLTLN